MDGVHLSQNCRATSRRQFTFTTKLPGVLDNLLIDLGKVKAELTLEPPSGFEPETPGLGIRRPNTTLKYNTFSACKLTMLVLGSSK